jgi:hypothetical protein
MCYRKLNHFILTFLILQFIGCGHLKKSPGAHPHQLPNEDSLAVEYSRSLYKHWVDLDRNCLDTRAEILKIRSLRPVKFKNNGCKIESGEWDDYYYNEKHFKATKVDIDHLIPLKHAHTHGAHNWDSEERQAFANDPENLVITNKKYNRKKGAKGIDEWLPIELQYACRYARDWISIKLKYRLSISQSEDKAIKKIEPKCKKLGHLNKTQLNI